MSAGETGLSDELLESLVGRLQQLKLQSSDPLAVQQSIKEVCAHWQSPIARLARLRLFCAGRAFTF